MFDETYLPCTSVEIRLGGGSWCSVLVQSLMMAVGADLICRSVDLAGSEDPRYF
jgi:hypothetical protein